jgi:hypothetical protein
MLLLFDHNKHKAIQVEHQPVHQDGEHSQEASKMMILRCQDRCTCTSSDNPKEQSITVCVFNMEYGARYLEYNVTDHVTK